MKRYAIELDRAERTTLTALLNRAVRFYSPADAQSLVERVHALVDGGEAPSSILARLNGPARRSTEGESTLVVAEPEPSRATLSIVRNGVRTPPPATPMRGTKLQALVCIVCGGTWHRVPKRGRKPVRCEACR